MLFDRRQFLLTTGAAALSVPAVSYGQSKMYGLIGKMRTQPGQRDALIAILLAGTGGMPGCLSYVVAKDPADADGIWITEVWDSEESHQASLTLPNMPLMIDWPCRIGDRSVAGMRASSAAA